MSPRLLGRLIGAVIMSLVALAVLLSVPRYRTALANKFLRRTHTKVVSSALSPEQIEQYTALLFADQSLEAMGSAPQTDAPPKKSARLAFPRA